LVEDLCCHHVSRNRYVTYHAGGAIAELCTPRCRLETLIDWIESFAKFTDILYNDTLMAPWIWIPMQLIMTMTLDYRDIFGKIVDVYNKLARSVPYLDQLIDVLPLHPRLEEKINYLYVDILEFHTMLYSFVADECKMTAGEKSSFTRGK
jgi:hypothetical protein